MQQIPSMPTPTTTAELRFVSGISNHKPSLILKCIYSCHHRPLIVLKSSNGFENCEANECSAVWTVITYHCEVKA